MRPTLPLILLIVPALTGCISELFGDDGLEPAITKVVQVDPDRWSGEPSILAMRDGTLLITGAGGMTRYAEDPSDIPGNAGQSYIWRSTDGGDSWRFVSTELPDDQVASLFPYRTTPPGVEGDLAEDQNGRAYFTDLGALAYNMVAASDDSGQTWTAAENPAVGLPGTDRPWVAATQPDQVYLKYLQEGTGHRVAHSTDGGQTFLEDTTIPCSSQADMTVDPRTDDVLVACADGSLSFVRTAPGTMAWEQVALKTADGDAVNGTASFVFPSMAVAQTGHYLFLWAQPTDQGAEVRISASMDAGETWSPARTLSTPGHTAVFPWIDANEDGTIGAVWYEADTGGDPNTIDASWYVMHATLELRSDGLSGAQVVQVAPEPVHRGSICTAGLGCVTEGRSDDRRLLDFFEVDVDEYGTSHIAWTNTQTSVPTIWYGQVTTTTA